jgi:hypothetical protein
MISRVIYHYFGCTRQLISQGLAWRNPRLSAHRCSGNPTKMEQPGRYGRTHTRADGQDCTPSGKLT